jgi:hypothetical protein
MMERPSLHRNWILKRTSFRVGPDLRPAAMNRIKRFRANKKHTDQGWKITPQPILAASTNHWLPSQIASTRTTLFMLSP